MCRTFLLWCLLIGTTYGGGYQFTDADESGYNPFPATGRYDPFGSNGDVSTPPATRNDKPTETHKTANAFGRDRAVIVMAEWCVHCPKKEVAKAVAAMLAKGWKIGPEATNAIQLLDVDKHQAESDRVLNALGQSTTGLPFMVAVEGGKIVRRLETGCTTPIDQWSLGWLATGIDERPDREKEPATVRRSGNYPLRGGWWTVNQYPARANSPSRSYIIRHLTAGGVHAGKFAADWLASLSIPELHSLHSDDHEGHIRWNYVNKYGEAKPATLARSETPSKPCPYCPTAPVSATTKPKPAKIVATTGTPLPKVAIQRSGMYCPTGNCPYSSQRIFRR